jgi:hypothetical protein
METKWCFIPLRDLILGISPALLILVILALSPAVILKLSFEHSTTKTKQQINYQLS